MISNRPIIVTDTDVSRLRALRANGALAAELDNAEIVPAGGVPPNVVTMNSRVRFEDMPTGASREITIVFPQDADASLGRVSVLAPVGTALLGLAEGDSISWPFPDGQSRRLRVVEVTFQPESHASSTATHGDDAAMRAAGTLRRDAMSVRATAGRCAYDGVPAVPEHNDPSLFGTFRP